MAHKIKRRVIYDGAICSVCEKTTKNAYYKDGQIGHQTCIRKKSKHPLKAVRLTN